MFKKCSKCLTEQLIECFNKNKSTKDGLSRFCKQCSKKIGYIEYSKKKQNQKNDVFYTTIDFSKTKKCSTCQELRQFFDFHKRKTSSDGFNRICKNCQKNNDEKRYYNNIAKEKGRVQDYYKNHTEERLAYSKRYNQENNEKVKENRKLYYDKTRDLRIKESKEYYELYKIENTQTCKVPKCQETFCFSKYELCKKHIKIHLFYPNLSFEELFDFKPPSRNTNLLRSWSHKVRSRDDHTCQKCQSREKLHAHHIKLKYTHPELALDISNGITLCNFCHIQLHKQMYENSIVDSEEFIKIFLQ